MGVVFSVSSNWTVKYLVHFNPIATAQSVAKKLVEEISFSLSLTLCGRPVVSVWCPVALDF